MAEGGGYKEEEFHSFMLASDFSFDFYCELCTDDGKNLEAEGWFCVDCEEYLCASCYNAHCKTRHTRLHQLLDKESMPKDTPLSADRINKNISTKYNRHANKVVEFYCERHNVLGCSLCLMADHRSCSNTESIVEKSESILDSQEYKDFIQTMKSLVQESHDLLEKSRANMTCYSDVIRSVRLFREKVIMDLNKFEQDIIAEAQTLMSEEEEKMAHTSNTCSEVTNKIKNQLAELESLQSSRRVCQVYISMKESSDQVKELQKNLSDADNVLSTRTFWFKPNRKFQNFIDIPKTIGNISFRDQTHTKRHKDKSTKLWLLKPKPIADIAVKSNRQRQTSCITGSVVLSNNRLVVVDCNTNRVKLLDSQTKLVINELDVFHDPWEVTAIDWNQVAISLRRSNIILVLGISNRQKREIKVSGQSYGVAYSNGRLVVTYRKPSYTEIMDLSGKVMKRIEHDRDGNDLFQLPNYACVSNDGETIYISDCGIHKVNSLTFDGGVKSVYSDSELRSPQKLCVDHNDNVFVCGRDSRNVHMLTAELTKMQIILTPADGLDSGMYSICHCKETNRLYVGMSSGEIKVFQLS